MVFVEVDFFCFQAPEPALDHDVVRPAGFSVHALPDLHLFQQRLIFSARELASLVAVDDGQCSVFFRRCAEEIYDLLPWIADKHRQFGVYRGLLSGCSE